MWPVYSKKSASATTTVALVLLILASGCIGPAAKDCGSDEACFSESLSTCSPAKITTIEKQYDILDLHTKYIFSSEIKGREGDLCVVNYETEKIELTGNLSGSPARLLFILISLVDTNMTCKTSGDISLSMDDIEAGLGDCGGKMKDLLVDTFEYEKGNYSTKLIKVQENFCVGGERIIVYIRNMGENVLDIGDVSLRDKSSGQELSVQWKDFTGSRITEQILSREIVQTAIDAVPGTLYSFEIIIDERPYPFSVQC